MSTIIGIDQSYTSTGVCIRSGDQIVYAGVLTTDKSASTFDRAWSIADQIEELVSKYNPVVVRLEGLPFGSVGNATRDLAGLLYTVYNRVDKVCAVRCEVIGPTTLKKFATGSGNAAKQDMIDKLPEEVSAYLSTVKLTKKQLTDVADAYWLSVYTAQEEAA